MSYKITIEQTTERRGPYEHEWKTVYESDMAAREAGKESQYAYVTPPGERTIYTKTLVFVQEVEALDVYAVIRAINE